VQARRPRPFALRDDLLALTPKRALALRHEGEWSTHSTALQGGPGAAGMRRRARAHRNPGGSPGRARQALNSDTIKEMHAAFRQGGRKAIDKVMKQQPAIFLKLLVLLVPREMTVEHKGGVKAMTGHRGDPRHARRS